jgi:hypothetical protein
MTQNQTNQLVKNPNTKKAIAVLQKFAQLEAQYKNAEKESKEAAELIKNAMIEQGIPKIDIDMPGLTGYITLAERVNYKAEDVTEVASKFTKKTLDTAKVKAHATLTGELPKGVEETRTQYITKKFKEEK